MTELRQKMIRAMELKNLSAYSQRAYLSAVSWLARNYRQSPTAIIKDVMQRSGGIDARIAKHDQTTL